SGGIGIVPWALRGFVATAACIAVAAHVSTGSAPLGLGASALLLVSAALTARPMFLALKRPISSALVSRGPTVRIAFGTLMRSPRRSALVISTIGVGLGTVLWLWTLARSFEQSVLDVMPGVLRGDLAVSSSNVGAGYIEAPIDDALVAELQGIPGVRAVIGEQAADWKLNGGPISINAFDSAYFSDASLGRWRLIGRQLPGLWNSVALG